MTRRKVLERKARELAELSTARPNGTGKSQCPEVHCDRNIKKRQFLRSIPRDDEGDRKLFLERLSTPRQQKCSCAKVNLQHEITTNDCAVSAKQTASRNDILGKSIEEGSAERTRLAHDVVLEALSGAKVRRALNVVSDSRSARAARVPDPLPGNRSTNTHRSTTKVGSNRGPLLPHKPAAQPPAVISTRLNEAASQGRSGVDTFEGQQDVEHHQSLASHVSVHASAHVDEDKSEPPLVVDRQLRSSVKFATLPNDWLSVTVEEE